MNHFTTLYNLQTHTHTEEALVCELNVSVNYCVGKSQNVGSNNLFGKSVMLWLWLCYKWALLSSCCLTDVVVIYWRF